MQIDWGNGIVTGVIALVGIGVAELRSGARHEEAMRAMSDKLDDHHERLREHDEQFKLLPTQYMLRSELEARFAAIMGNTAETIRQLRWLVYYKTHPNAPEAALMPPVPPEILPPEA
ncbi:hypothetical protein DYQ86_16185 [Acidobacteria bacterium AB60]|nr:hypothetical protein DYQ86_16185 [Acidobacteria bacterium AB60]